MHSSRCPVKIHANLVIATSQDLAKELRRLKRDLNRCRSCEEYPDCVLWQEFNDMFDKVLEEIHHEWETREI